MTANFCLSSVRTLTFVDLVLRGAGPISGWKHQLALCGECQPTLTE
jgi:hypothetical protein